MGKIIAVIGNSGVGKTTFSHALCAATGWACALEQPAERPFQRLFKQDFQRYALANQVDFLLFRAEQEQALRRAASPGVVDGGLDLDFQLFTRLFFESGYLAPEEFTLLERLYRSLRYGLPPPELIIYLSAPLEVIRERFAHRGRSLEIASTDNLAALQSLLEAWLAKIPSRQLISIDAGQDNRDYQRSIPGLLARLQGFA